METLREPSLNLMDRFADQVGKSIPGCAHLPPRHPIKVTLVMVILGHVAGWLVGMWFIGSILIPVPFYAHPQMMPLVYLSIFGMFSLSGLFILVPLSVWTRQRTVITVCSWIVPCLAFPLMIIWNGIAIQLGWVPMPMIWNSFFGTASMIAIITGVHAVWVAVILRRHTWFMILATALLGTFIPAKLFQLMTGWSSVPQPLHLIVILTVTTTSLMLLGVCLGISAWEFPTRRVIRKEAPNPG